MIISVQRMPDHDILLYFYVRPEDSVDQLKDMIEAKIGMPSDVQALTYSGQELETGTMADCKICENAKLQLGTKIFLEIQVHVKRQEAAATVTIKQDDFIEDLEKILKTKMDYKTSVEQLMCNGRALERGRKLAYYKIQDGANIEIGKRPSCTRRIFKVRGWMGGAEPFKVQSVAKEINKSVLE